MGSDGPSLISWPPIPSAPRLSWLLGSCQGPIACFVVFPHCLRCIAFVPSPTPSLPPEWLCNSTAQVLGNKCVGFHKPIDVSSLTDVAREEQRRRKAELRERNEQRREDARKIESLIPADPDPTLPELHLHALDDDLDAADNDGAMSDNEFAARSLNDSAMSLGRVDTPTQAERWVQEAVQQVTTGDNCVSSPQPSTTLQTPTTSTTLDNSQDSPQPAVSE